MVEREIAWRVFAGEFNQSNFKYTEGDDRSPAYIITPTGARCNRVFIVGVLTEVENIGQGEDLWRARVADPTGAFAVYAGQFQPEAAMFLSEAEIPSYLAIVGKTRIFEPEPGTVYTTIRPEEINKVEADVRNRWVLTTAERTLDRINHIKTALDSKLTGEALAEHLITRGLREDLTSGITQAIVHYNVTEATLQKLRQIIIDALESVIRGEEAQIETEKDTEKESPVKENIFLILCELDKGEGASYEDVIITGEKQGLTEQMIEDALKDLMNEGRVYEPRIGILRKI